MKILQSIFIGVLLIAFGCKDGYIDDISSVSPGADEAAPEVEINYPLEGTQIRVREDVTSINIQFEASDDIEVDNISVKLDGSEIASFDSFKDYRQVIQSYSYNKLSNGAHTLTITATDLSDKSTSTSVNFEKVEPYQPYDGEIFYMPFDGDYFELVGIREATGGVHTTFADGVKGKALSLDAAQKSYLIFEPDSTVTDVESFSLSFWVNPEFVDADNNGGIDGILGLVNLSNVNKFWGNIDFFVENGSNPTDGADMRIHITNGSDETWITNVNDIPGFFGQWTNHILTYDASSSEFKYYINGVLMTTASASWSGAMSFEDSGPLVMGAVQFQTDPSLTSATGSQPWASYLTGELDEVRIFNKALSQEEIDVIVNNVD